MNSVVVANSHVIDVQGFRAKLLRWWPSHQRHFPWRQTDDPYRIIVAEFMLHRTQATQVVPVYERFVEQYPDVLSLAHANLTNIGTLLYPLGLTSRCNTFVAAAQMLVERFAGMVPMETSDLMTLPGVSQYISAAVRCFAWNLPDAIVDTNTVRIVGRLFGIELKDSLRRNRRFVALIRGLADPERPRDYNYALLDLAAGICTKKTPPACERCPLRHSCAIGMQRIVEGPFADLP